jgi:hypothetical protein
MLETWGSTCGRCRPKIVQPKSPTLVTTDEPAVELAWLVVLSSPEEERAGEIHPVPPGSLILTRKPAQTAVAIPGQLAFLDDFMSSGHATLRKLPDRAGWTIEDRASPSPSANGTFVNAHQVEPGESYVLCDGDVIRIGTTELYFRALLLPGAAPLRGPDL